jgi:hypothetical protein
VTTIDPHQPLAAALQAQVAALRERAAARASAGAPAKQASAQQPLSPAMTQRIAAIDGADPQRRRKAVRVVLEAELAREFGPALLNDPTLPQLLDAVQDQMQADAQLAEAVHALGDWLLAQPAA